MKVPRGSWVIQKGANSGVGGATIAIAKGLGLKAVNVSKAHLTDRGLAVLSITCRLAALRLGDQLARPLGQVTWAIDIVSPRAEAYREPRGPGLKDRRGRLAAAKQRTIGPRVGAT